jgi:hypothetical protein
MYTVFIASERWDMKMKKTRKLLHSIKHIKVNSKLEMTWWSDGSISIGNPLFQVDMAKYDNLQLRKQDIPTIAALLIQPA